MTSAFYWTEASRLQGIEVSLIRQVMQNAPQGAINMALGELSFPMPDFLKQAAIRELTSGTAVYTPNAGLPTLRDAVASYYQDGSTAEQICVCNGAEEAVYLTLLALINTDDTIAIPDPDYTAYPAIARMMGAKVLRLPLHKDLQSIDWAAWEKNLTAEVKLLLLSNPSNPCGYCFSQQDLITLAKICNNKHIIVVVDEIYRHLHIHEQQPSLDKSFDNLIRIGGLSKSHCMSGWRLGWVYAPKEIAPSIIKAKQYVSTCAPWLSQKLALAALSSEGWNQAEQIRKRLAANQSMALEVLRKKENTILAPPAGPYLMIRIGEDDLEFATNSAKKGVICVPGSAFGRMSSGWIRLNVGLPEADLMQGLNRFVTLI